MFFWKAISTVIDLFVKPPVWFWKLLGYVKDHCKMKCKGCAIATLVVVALFGGHYISKDNVETLMLQAEDTGSIRSRLPELTRRNVTILLYENTSEVGSAKFTYDVDKLIYRMAKQGYDFKLIAVTIYDRPATVWRLSDNYYKNRVIFANSTHMREYMLLARKDYITRTIAIKDGKDINYHTLYREEANVPNIDVFHSNIDRYNGILSGKLLPEESPLKHCLHYFIFYNKMVYVFSECGGTQIHNDANKNEKIPSISYERFTHKDFCDTKYRVLLEDEVKHEVCDL